MAEVNSDDFFKKVITEIEKHEEAIEHFVSVLKDTKIVLPAEKTVENISEAMKKAVIIKLISSRAGNIFDFLYSTEKRQVLADCVKPECTFYENEIKEGKVMQFYQCSTIRECKSFQENKLRELSAFFQINSTLVKDNLPFIANLFPCWTGTLTCFIMNSGAGYNILTLDSVPQCKELQKLLMDTDKIHKLFSILFILEIIDDWKQIQAICNSREGEALPKMEQIDCVPIPNTMFIDNKSMHGSCLISTVRSLIAILEITAKADMRKELVDYFRAMPNFKLPGITSTLEQTAWWNILNKTVHLYDMAYIYTADFPNFIEILNGMLQKPINITPLYGWFKIYRGYFIDYLSRNIKMHDFSEKIKTSFPNEAISSILTEIMSNILGKKITVEATTKPHEIWPMFELKISDDTQKIEITVGVGNVGQGQHIEITDISYKALDQHRGDDVWYKA